MSVEDAAIELGITPQRVRVMCREGRLGTRLGRNYVITAEELERFKAMPREKGRPKSEPVVYFLKNSDTGRIKIGFSDNLRRRLMSLGNEGNFEPELLGIVEGGRDVERQLHNQFRQYRYANEWFDPGPELLEYIRANTQKPAVYLGQDYIAGPGRDSFKAKHGEEGVSFKMLITESQHTFLKMAAERDGVSIAEYIRKLIHRDITRDQPITTLRQERQSAATEGEEPPY